MFCFYCMKVPINVVFLSGWKLQKKLKYLSNGLHTRSRWLPRLLLKAINEYKLWSSFPPLFCDWIKELNSKCSFRFLFLTIMKAKSQNLFKERECFHLGCWKEIFWCRGFPSLLRQEVGLQCDNDCIPICISVLWYTFQNYNGGDRKYQFATSLSMLCVERQSWQRLTSVVSFVVSPMGVIELFSIS